MTNTNQEKKEYLQRYRYLERNIQRKVEEIRKWRERAVVITPQYSQAIRGSGGDRLQGAVEMIVLLCDDLQKEVAELLGEGEGIRMAIEEIEDPTLRLLLKYRYIDCMKWDEIAKALHYEPDAKRVFALHGKALERLQIESNTVKHLNPRYTIN